MRRSRERLDVKVNSVGTVHVNVVDKVVFPKLLPVTTCSHSLEIGTAGRRRDGVSQRRSGVRSGVGSGVRGVDMG